MEEPEVVRGPSWQSSEFKDTFAPYYKEIQGLRWRPALWDIACGCILWLPAKHQIAKDDLDHDPALRSLPAWRFDHPVIVVDTIVTSPTDAIICFIPMSSFGGRDTSKVGRKKKGMGAVLPIEPTPTIEGSTTLLKLEKKTKHRHMTDNSYACIDEGLYFIGWKGLRCYAVGQKPDGFRHRLTKESMSEVTKALNLPEKSFVETNLLWEYFKNTFLTLLSKSSIGE